MAVIRKNLSNKKFTKIENRVFAIDKKLVCDGAKVLYGFLATFINGKKVTDGYIMKSLDLSDRTLRKYKVQLKKVGLIYIERTGPRDYDLYVGTLEVSAELVKEFWEHIPNDEPLTMDDIKKIRGEK